MRPDRASRQRAAFTLIEVLVVVAIIALLVAVLLPSLTRAKQQALAVVCRTNLSQIARGVQTYQLAHKGYLPHNVWSEAAWGVGKPDLWFYKLKKELPDPEIWICPADPFQSRFDFEANTRRFKRTNHMVASCGYGMNYLVRHIREPHSFNVEYYHPKRPSNTILLAEVGPDDTLRPAPLNAPATNENDVGQPWRDGGRLLWDDGRRPWYTGEGARTWLTARHYGHINMSAMDGSVKFAPTVRLLTSEILGNYPDCRAGGCYWCVYDNQPHYNFAHVKLYWWTGGLPVYPR